MKPLIQLSSCCFVTIFVLLINTGCNKSLPEAEPITTPSSTGATLYKLLDDPDFSILKAAVTRAGTGVIELLNDTSSLFTFFAPDNAAFQLSGFPNEAAVNFLSPESWDAALRYHLIGGQKITYADISDDFPNMYLQSLLVLSAPSPSLPPGYRMPLFPSRRGGFAWANNIPIVEADILAANGVLHKVAALIAPPTNVLFERVATDPDLTYLNAAVQRADSGDVNQTLQSALSNPAANLTVYAPTNLAFQQILSGQITLALMGQGLDQATAVATATALASSPTVFQNPALFSVLTAQTVKGLLFYHILGIRVFSVNMPSTSTGVPTLLNTVSSAYPGLAIQATFGTTGVTAATVKGFANPTPSNLLINPATEPGGTSDQHYVNGILHKIDQVLRLQ